ncbi:membrane transporter [Xylariomycetidae sp. FL0641]|nr:membrane transporter [Xylariomycetidae sp. FL0641]
MAATTDIERQAEAISTPPTGPDLKDPGKQRPEMFGNAFVEIGFCISVLGSNMLAEFLISGFNILLPNLISDIGFSPDDRTWPLSVFSLVTGAFLLPFGRLADMYGGYVVYMAGLGWMAIWALVGGFSNSYTMLIVTRALQGLGAAAFLPAGLTLLGKAYRPGPRKNTVFSLYGGCAPFGFFLGILFAGVCGQFIHWGWFFWVGAILLAVLVVLTFLCVPPDRIHDTTVTMDWWGCATSVAALLLLVYSITDSSHVEGGWRSPQILVTFILSVFCLGAFAYVEARVAVYPLLPPSLDAQKSTAALFLCLLLGFGAFGIYLFYASLYIETILNVPSLLAALWFAPLAGGGVIIALVGGLVLHRLSGTLLLALACAGLLVCNLLFALMPEKPLYWAWVFPAMACTTIGVDIMYNVSSIFITTRVPKEQQGLAGACISGLVFLGMSFFLGWADFAALTQSHLGLETSYNTALYLGVGCAGAALLVVVFGIRIGKATSELESDEKSDPQAVVQ